MFLSIHRLNYNHVDHIDLTYTKRTYEIINKVTKVRIGKQHTLLTYQICN